MRTASSNAKCKTIVNGLIGAIVAITAGCGQDDSVSGVALVGDSAGAGQDAATLADGADATNSEDSTINVTDTTVVSVCGDGKCSGTWENAQSCPVDCTGPITGPDGGPIGVDIAPIKDGGTSGGGLKNCGNGICETDELMLTCPADCKTAVIPQENCIQKACPDLFKGCQSDPECVKIIDCLTNTVGNQQKCFGTGGDKITNSLLQCAQKGGCLGVPGGQGGGGTAASCGNGACDNGESMLTCPKDCPQPKTKTEACYHDKCPDQYAKCAADIQCVKTVDCFNTGGTPQECGDNANQKALNLCTTSSGCNGAVQNCGNGACDKGETNLSCPKDCPKPVSDLEVCMIKACPDQYKACQADSKCTSAIACYNNGGSPQQCFSGGGPALGGLIQCVQNSGCLDGGGNNPVCGDGQCDQPDETPQNCPQDCAPPVTPCKTKKDCADNQVCCAQPSGPICVGIGQCN